MRVGIVGAGFMGETHARAWAATPAQVAAIYAPREEPTRKLAQQVGASACRSLQELIDQVDVVDVCAPTDQHAAIGLQAAAAGRHLLVEKPLARKLGEGQELLQACEQAGVQLLVGHVLRFFPEYVAAQAAVTRGDIGDVAMLRLTRGSFQPWAGTAHWLTDESRSGGLVLDLMIHDFDYAQWVAGPVESVHARSVRSREAGAPGDYCLALLQHRGGAISHVEGAWAYPQPLFRTALEIAGSEGLIEQPVESTAPLDIRLVQQDAEGADIVAPTSPLAEDPFVTQMRNIHDVLADGAAPRCSAAEALAALRIALAARESARCGRPVRPDELVAEAN
ncbi:MAG: Gfo/Idh/MocA family oxidoreductase [Anaerolineaceae bacterium]|nr:Gfo/Idh/MocA family oxidoreductase [Anaerolineaceae bacterium]MDE0328049.1 Gfo/Idh/MocA family oxidoreductase [Anaerolineaceae bacterium]